MLLTQSALKEGSAELVAGIAAARSARNLMTRRRREDATDEHEAKQHHRRRKRKDERELEQLLRHRVRVRVPYDERPRIGTTTARKLYHRTDDMLRGTTGITDARGPDGIHSLHFGFVARASRLRRAGAGARARPSARLAISSAKMALRAASSAGGQISPPIARSWSPSSARPRLWNATTAPMPTSMSARSSRFPPS